MEHQDHGKGYGGVINTWATEASFEKVATCILSSQHSIVIFKQLKVKRSVCL